MCSHSSVTRVVGCQPVNNINIKAHVSVLFYSVSKKTVKVNVDKDVRQLAETT